MPTRPAMPAAVTSSPSPWPPFPWLADYRLAPVIVLPLLMLMQVVLMAMVVILCACSSKCVGILLYVILVLVLLAVFYYIGIRHTAIIVLYRILRVFIIPALRRNFPSVVCQGQCKPSVVHSHYGLEHLCGARVGKRSAAVVLTATRPPKPPCWGYYAPRCRHSRHRRAGKSKEVCSQQPGKPVSSLHPFIPQPQGDERPGTYLRRTVRAVRRTLDIIYRDCVTGCRGPNPSTSFRYRTQSRLKQEPKINRNQV